MDNEQTQPGLAPGSAWHLWHEQAREVRAEILADLNQAQQKRNLFTNITEQALMRRVKKVIGPEPSKPETEQMGLL